MDDVGKLVLFRDVVDAGGFTPAAIRRGLSHSTVSKHVKSLEVSLGVQLLNRTSRSMSLTEAGRVVLGYSRDVGASVAALEERLDELRGEVMGELRIGCLLHIGRHLVQPAMQRYLAQHPRARIRLLASDGPLHFTRDGLDLAVRVGLDVESSLTARKLIDNEVQLVASPSLVSRIGAPSHPSALADLPTVGYRIGEVVIDAWRYEEGDEIRSVVVRPIAEVSDGNALLDLAIAGVGIAYVSAFAAREAIREGALVPILPELRLPAYDPVYLLSPGRAHRTLKVAAFETHLKAVAAELH